MSSSRAGRRMLRAHHGERQRLADPPAIAAVGGAADQLAVAPDRLRAARVGVGDAVHLHRHEASIWRPSARSLDQRVAADELALVRMHEAVEAAIRRPNIRSTARAGSAGRIFSIAIAIMARMPNGLMPNSRPASMSRSKIVFCISIG